MTDNITKTYKLSNNCVYNCINLEAKHIVKHLTLKGHKENANINPKCRLIHPAKSELAKVAKIIVENINKTVREKLHCNQWRNTSNVMDWFQNTTDKENCKFIQFDIEEFYPSITEHLLLKAIEHANITQQGLDIILHARESLLFSKINHGRKQLMNHYLT